MSFRDFAQICSQTIGKQRLEASAGASSSSRLSLAALLRLSWAAAPSWRDSGKAGEAQLGWPGSDFIFPAPLAKKHVKKIK